MYEKQWFSETFYVPHGAYIQEVEPRSSDHLYAPTLHGTLSGVLYSGLLPGRYHVTELLAIHYVYDTNMKTQQPRVLSWKVANPQEMDFTIAAGKATYVGLFEAHKHGRKMSIEWFPFARARAENVARDS